MARKAGNAATLLSVSQASAWASDMTGRNVTPSNISYLIRYNRIAGTKNGGALQVDVDDLKRYYESQIRCEKELHTDDPEGELYRLLSFSKYKEAETTKHIHRLHPYKGKFIPQLVEYFLDAHTDAYKTDACFSPGDIILDPFCGSGTTLAQANELGMHAVGIDISPFNTMISNLKLSCVSPVELTKAARWIGDKLAADDASRAARDFEEELLDALKTFNGEFFPAPEFRQKVRQGLIDEKRYSAEKANQFLPRFNDLLKKHGIDNKIDAAGDAFLDNWYLPSVKAEIAYVKSLIEKGSNPLLTDMLRLILSRSVRSARATSHSDLATLVKPVTETYYCRKHSKICKPIFSMFGWWQRYADDTVKRLVQFEKLRTDTRQICMTGDSRGIDIFDRLSTVDAPLGEMSRKKKIRGIFSSPPYVGMIDYHEQHAYAYELFGLPRNDSAEIGPLRQGKSRQAQEAYIEGIAQVLRNCREYMVDDADIFLVANDKMTLYPRIAECADLAIVKEYHRPVLNRSEGDKGSYAETIFHMQGR